MATDIAFALGVLALLGERVPVGLKVFLAALAIVDDVGAVLVIALFYTGSVAWGALGAAAVLLLVAAGANLAGVRRPWAYGLLGLALWAAVLASGVHATVAGVLLAMTIPVRTRIDEPVFLASARRALYDFDAAAVVTATDPDTTVLSNTEHHTALEELETLAERAQPPLIRLEHALHGIVAFGIMPLFALANAGVALSGEAFRGALASPVTRGVLLGLALGKPLGITGFSWLAVRLGIAALPSGVSWRMIAGAGVLGGIGFTMALFIAGLAFTDAGLLEAAKFGILGASVNAGVIGWLLLRRSAARLVSRPAVGEAAVPELARPETQAETSDITNSRFACFRITMRAWAMELASLESLITGLEGAPPLELRVELRPLRGGLEATGIHRVTARYRDRDGRTRVFSAVVKRLAGATLREAAVYERFVATHAGDLSPRLLGTQHVAPDRALLCLEAVRRVGAWPWRENLAPLSVLECIARVHALAPSAEAVAALTDWDYEAALAETSALTLERLEQARRQPALRGLGVGLRSARRIVGSLSALRRQLLAFAPLGRSVVHGDLHPGNVVLRQRRGGTEPVLLDWGRARIGSPLEDVSCWLQSLGAWEPEARRRHDSLFVGYLAARGLPPRLDSHIRTAYWLAGASNALSGAMLYHLSVLLDERRPSATRALAAQSAREWVRVLRRADTLWR